MIASVRTLIENAKHVVVLTGAGMSTESGVPDFRGPNGLWREHDVMQVASIETFRNNAPFAWEFYRDRFTSLAEVEPNAGHLALALLEEQGKIASVLTQNIDGLHRQAGQETLHEVHGTISLARCLNQECAVETIPMTEALAQKIAVPLCPSCGSFLKPDVTLFGELLPPAFELALEEVDQCDLLICCGSSLLVTPVSMIPYQVRNTGGKVVIINSGPTGYDREADIVIDGRLGEVLPQLITDKDRALGRCADCGHWFDEHDHGWCPGQIGSDGLIAVETAQAFELIEEFDAIQE